MAKRILIDVSVEIKSNITMSEAALIRNQIINELMADNVLIKDISINMVDKQQLDLSSKFPMDYRRKILNHIKKEMSVDLRKYDAFINLNEEDIDVLLISKSKEKATELKKVNRLKHNIKVKVV